MMTEPFNNPGVDALAWQIWSAKGGSLPIEDSDMRARLEPAIHNGVLLEDENGYKFSSQLDMIKAAARHFVFLEAVDLLASPQRCFERLHALWIEEISSREQVSGHALALLHNAGRIDAFSWGREAIEADTEVFGIVDVFQGAIPLFLGGNSASIISFFISYYEKVKNARAEMMLFPKLDPWFSIHPQVAEEVRSIHLRDKNESSSGIFRSALQGLVLSNFISGFNLLIEAAESQEAVISVPAIHALGLIDFSEASRSSELDQAIQICQQVIGFPSHPAFLMAVRTLTWFIVFDERIADLLIRIAQTGEPKALSEISSFLSLKAKTYQERVWFRTLLKSLVVVKPQEKEILQNVDALLSDWIGGDSQWQDAIDFLDSWLANQDVQDFNQSGVETAFRGTINKLFQKLSLLSLTMTKWLLQDDESFPFAASKLLLYLRVVGIETLRLDSATVDGLSRNEIRFLVRRILGYLSGDVILIPLVFSLVYTRDGAQRTFGLVEHVLVKYIGHDFSYETIEYLKKKRNQQNETGDIKDLCGRVIGHLESRIEALSALPDLKELHSSLVKVRRFNKERHRQINNVFEEARKESIWSQLGTQIRVKAGRRTFQKVDNTYSVPMELKGYSHSAPIPGTEITDPTGSALERRLFRMAKRDDP